MPENTASTASHYGAYIMAYCTSPCDKADDIALELVKRRVCACVNVIPKLRSYYRWQGKIERDEEALLVIKTRADRYADLETVIREVHPYEVFELVASRIEFGNPAYLRWLDAALEPEA